MSKIPGLENYGLNHFPTENQKMSILNSCSNWLYSSASGIEDYAITIGKSKKFRRVGLQCDVLTTSTATFSVTKEPSLKVTMGGCRGSN